MNEPSSALAGRGVAVLQVPFHVNPTPSSAEPTNPAPTAPQNEDDGHETASKNVSPLMTVVGVLQEVPL